MEQIRYTRFKIRKHHSEKNCFEIETEHERINDMGKWEGGGHYCKLYNVPGGVVETNFTGMRPVKVWPSIFEFTQALKKKHPNAEIITV